MRLITALTSLFLLATVLTGRATVLARTPAVLCGYTTYRGQTFANACCKCPDSDGVLPTDGSCHHHSICKLVRNDCEPSDDCYNNF